MRALAKLVSINSPDKILFVGEALVGNEAVDQLTKFDRALKDFSAASGTGKERGIDGMLVTKWDTVDDKVRTPRWFARGNVDENSLQVGAALSMTYVTGQPIVFVGCGQVSIRPHLDFRCSLMEESHSDLHGPETVESGECRGGYPERLIRIESTLGFTTAPARDADGNLPELTL